MLEVKNLVVRYGHIEALKGVSLNVEKGEFVGVIGANGAGKSSLLIALSGAAPICGGQVFFDGRDITYLSQHRRVSEGIAIVPEGRQIFGPLSVKENLELGAFHRRHEDKHRIRDDMEKVLDIFPVLRERLRQIAATLSGGEQQMLAVGRALMSRPRLLLLDEPSFGLAAVIFDDILKTVCKLHAEGLTCLMVEQDAHITLATTARGYVFNTGNIVAQGTSSELRNNRLVEEIYLGQTLASNSI